MTVPARAIARPSAALRTDTDTVRERTSRLLRAAGFDIGDGTELVVVLLSCPASSRIPRIRAAAQQHPDAAVVATMPPEPSAALRQALDAGATGIVLDDQIAAALVPTVQAVLAGQLVVPPTLRRRFAPVAFSHRERQILKLVVDGYTNRQIADELFVAESTVKTHLASAFGKLDAHSRAEAAAMILDPTTGYGPAILGHAPDGAEDPVVPLR